MISQQAFVADPSGQTRHQDVVVDPVEELLQVHVHDDHAPFRHVFLGLLQRVVRAAAGPEAVAGIREGRVQQRFQHLQDRLLHQPVHHRRDAQLSHPAAGLGDFHPAHRLRLIRSVQQRCDQLIPVPDQPGEQAADGHPVHARRAFVCHHAAIRSVQVLSVGHLLHQVRSRLVLGRTPRTLVAPRSPKVGFRPAAGLGARILRRLLEEESLVNSALLPLHVHRVVPDCSLHQKIRPFVGE